jgi:hypothetical protein
MSDNDQGSGPSSELELLKTRARLLGVEFSNNIGLETLKERVTTKMAELDSGGDLPVQKPTPNVAGIGGILQPNPLGEEIEEPPLGDFDEGIEEEPALEGEQAGTKELEGLRHSEPMKPIAPIVDDVVDLGVGNSKGGQAVEKPLTLRQQLYNEQMRLVRVRIQNLDPKKKDLNGEVITVANRYLGTVKKFVPYGENTDDGWHLPYVIYKELAGRRFLQLTTVKDRTTKQVTVKKRWAKEFAIDILDPLTKNELAKLAATQAAAGSIENDDSSLL